MHWNTVDTQILPKNFYPNNQKDNSSVLVIYTLIHNNQILKKYTRINGNPPSPPYDMPIALVTFLLKKNEDDSFDIDRIKLDVDFHNFMPNKLYKVHIEDYDRSYAFIYRPDENAVVQMEGVSE